MSNRDDFWQRWSPWRHGPPGEGNFADVMRVLRTYETFAAFAAEHVEHPERGVTVLDLACGASPLAGPLARAIEARGGSVRRYLGVDFADPAWMRERVTAELRRHRLDDRGEYLHHDLATGLPADLASRIDRDGPLLIASCWGITYLDLGPLRALVDACAALAASRPSGAVLYVNMMTAGRFDRDVLTRRFLGEIVPRHVWTAARGLDLEPLRDIRRAIKALPRMRQFGDEVQHIARLMPVSDMLTVLREAGHPPARVDGSALWGQTTSLAVILPGAPRTT